MRSRISLTFISLTCLVGMMMLVTISRYGSDPVGEMMPIGIRVGSVNNLVQQSLPVESSWMTGNHLDENSIKHQVENIEDNNSVSNVIPYIYKSKSSFSPFKKLKVSNVKKWFIPGSGSKVSDIKNVPSGNSIVLDEKAGINNGGQGISFPQSGVTSSSSPTAIPSSSSFVSSKSAILQQSSPSSPPINIESTKKPAAIISSTSSTGLRSALELDFPAESQNQPSQQPDSNQLQLLQPEKVIQRSSVNPIASSSSSSSSSISQSSSQPRPILSASVTGHVSPPSSSSLQPGRIQTMTLKPKITFDEDDLELTNKFVINKLNFCDEDNGATIDLLVIIASALTHFDARDAIRKTWGGFAIERGAKLLFLLGSPSPIDEESSSKIQDQVYQEDATYGDILQGSFIDNYYNLTLKSISMLQWVNETCDAVKYVLKIDDDMFVNMQMMVDFSETRTFSKVIIGKLARKWRPHHDPKSKWFVPPSAFNGTIFPNFATGPAYILTGDATKYLLETALTSTPIYLEDVYVTGIVAEKAGIRRLNHALMKNVRLKVDACTFKRFITSHQHSPSEILHLWKVVYEPPIRNCTVIKSSVTTSSQSSAAAAAAQAAAAMAVAQLRQQRQGGGGGGGGIVLPPQSPPLPPTDVGRPSIQSQQRQVQSPSLTIQLPSSSAKLNLNLMKVVPPTSFQPQFPINFNPPGVPPVKVIPSS